MLQDRPSSDRARRILAIHEARRLAKQLTGLEPHQAEAVILQFLGTFLRELMEENGLDHAALLRIAHIPLDLVIEMTLHPRQPSDGAS